MIKKGLGLSIVVGMSCVVWQYRQIVYEPGALEQYMSYVAYPVLVVQHRIVAPIKEYFQKKRSMKEMHALLHAMQQDRDRLRAATIELQSALDYSHEIKELVDFKKRYEYDQTALAQVLVKNFSEQSHFYLVDRGSNQGVAIDMVALYKDCIIGKVVEVFPCYSKVLLVSDASCKIAAQCIASKACGIYQGSNQEWLASLEHVSHLAKLEDGEMIVSSGEGLVFPRGFGLGKVKQFSTDGLFHNVVVEPLVDLHAVSHCYLVQKGSM